MLTITEYLLQLTGASHLVQGRYYHLNFTHMEIRLKGLRNGLSMYTRPTRHWAPESWTHMLPESSGA